MGGDTTTKSLLRGAFRDAVRAPERVASSGEEEGEVGCVGPTEKPDGREDDGSIQRDGGGGDVGDQGEYSHGGFQLGEGGGAYSDGVQGGADCGGFHVSGGGPYPQGVKVLPWHWPCGGDVEGSVGYFKSPARILHHLPQLPP